MYALKATKERFLYVPVPRIVPVSGACENVDSLFEVHPPKNQDAWWNGQRAFFAQTGQLHLETLLDQHECLYVCGSSGRAEERVDGRHLSEFELLELEMKGTFSDLVSCIHTMFEFVSKSVLSMSDNLTEEEKDRIVALQNIQEVRYSDAIDILNRLGSTVKYGDDLHSVTEKMLSDHVGGPVLITHFPNNQHPEQLDIEVEKFFNMRPEHTNRVVLSCDLILPHSGECLGGAERIWEVSLLKERLERSKMYKLMLDKGLSMKDFDGYMSAMAEHGPSIGPHCGCGIGIPRVAQYILGTERIEDATSFVSTRDRLS